MLTAFARAFQTPDLRKKLLFTLGIMVLFRLGRTYRCRASATRTSRQCMKRPRGPGLFGLVNMFSGGALLQITIFALGIMPYITASIILQLLVVVIPRLEALKKEGRPAGEDHAVHALPDGRARRSAGHRPGGHRPQRHALPELQVASQIIPDQSIFTTIVMVITMTAGTCLIMWLGELITERASATACRS